VLRLNHVRAGYGSTPVLHEISLSLGSGEIAAVLGRNGAGKTTLMRAISGTIPCTGGSLSLDETDLGSLSAYKRARLGISHVPQGRAIFPKLTVAENLQVAASAVGKSQGVDFEETFEQFPVLAEKRKARGGSLSGGQQQILALARALMARPRLLLLDEPSEGIQPSILDEIATTVEQINSQRGIAVLVVEQNLDFAARIAHRGLIMDKGEIVEELDITELSRDRELQRRYMAL